MWAQIKQSNNSLSSSWRNDALQIICTFQHNSLYDAQSSRVIFCHFFQRPHGFLRRPIPWPPNFDLEDALIFFSSFQRKGGLFHHPGSAISIFTCSGYSSAGDSRCHWPCIRSCCSFSITFHDAPSSQRLRTTANSLEMHLPSAPGTCWPRGTPRHPPPLPMQTN